jgi:hypothetical protein
MISPNDVFMRMEVDRGREAFQLCFAMIIIAFFDQSFPLRRGSANRVLELGRVQESLGADSDR